MMLRNGNGHWEGMHDHGEVGWVVVLLLLIVAIAVVVGVVALLRWAPILRPGPGSAGSGGTRDPRAILEERFARGEIDEQDYRSRVRALEDTGG